MRGWRVVAGLGGEGAGDAEHSLSTVQGVVYKGVGWTSEFQSHAVTMAVVGGEKDPAGRTGH